MHSVIGQNRNEPQNLQKSLKFCISGSLISKVSGSHSWICGQTCEIKSVVNTNLLIFLYQIKCQLLPVVVKLAAACGFTVQEKLYMLSYLQSPKFRFWIFL